MSLKKLLHDFLISEGKVELIKEYGNFLDMCSDKEYELSLTEGMLANIDFKHRFAKYIVKRQEEGDWIMLDSYGVRDHRLSSFIAYFAVIRLLNFKLSVQKIEGLKYLLRINSCFEGCYLSGLSLNECHSYMPVVMSPGGGFQQGYRMFVINLLCFRHRKLLMGCRCESGPIQKMKYNKGCYPHGIRKDSQGRGWTIFQVDASLTDDYTAIFSNFLDGDGTVEICDWVGDTDIRIIFRSNY